MAFCGASMADPKHRRYPATARYSGSAERVFHFRANPLGANWGETWAFETN
jgi:hypothetical protein